LAFDGSALQEEAVRLPRMIATLAAARYDAAVHSLVVQTAREMADRQLFTPGENLLVAVSGGRDSMVLLAVLFEVVPSPKQHLVVAHFDHGLRGAASSADAAFVQRHASRMGLRCISERGDVPELKRRNRLSIEMAARLARHEFLARTAQTIEAGTVVLGHHQDDQVELFFLRLLRGAGGSGLGGMQWSSPSPANRKLCLIRPFLSQNRAALAAYARERKVPFRRDASNRTLEPLRNRIRLRLLPLLRRDYQEAVDGTVWRSMAILGAEADFAREAAAQWLKEPHRIGFHRLHLAVQREALRSQLLSVGVSGGFDMIEQLRQSVGQPVTVSPNLAVVRDETGQIQVMETLVHAAKPDALEVELKGRGGECSFAGLKICWQRVAGQGACQRGTRRPGAEQFDAAKVGDRVVLRHWRPGDRFQPIGMPAPVKLQDLFVNAKIARARRHRLVVATTGWGELFWVEGLRMAEGFRLDNQSQQRLKWRWHRRGERG
jgi:tRNA(Ile)-lysidine synthase